MSSDRKLSKTFYLPHEPVTYDKNSSRLSLVLPYFYTNASDSLHIIFPGRLSEPLAVSQVYDEQVFPESSTYIQLVYERTDAPNCEGVSRYVLSENSVRTLKAYWNKDKLEGEK